MQHRDQRGSRGTGWSARRWKRLPIALLALCSLMLSACGSPQVDSSTSDSPAVTVTIDINTGGSATGSFVADVDFSGGSTYSTTNAIDTSLVTGTVPPQAVFQTERYGAFTYTIPGFTAGSAATVTLYFQESYWSAAGQRTFNVAINGATVLSAFDIFAAAGARNKAVARAFNTTADGSGQVVIQFTKGSGPDNPKICGMTVATVGTPPPPPTTYALTVTKSGAGSGTVSGGAINCGNTCSATVADGTIVALTATPASGSTFGGWSGACSGTGTCTVTMNADQSVTATFNTIPVTTSISINAGGSATGSFVADVDFSGGSTYTTTNTIDTSLISAPVPPQAVFQSERYGAFTYTIPGLTAGGAYAVTLYFQESYVTAAGQRLFNVAVNGSTVLSAFDIFAAAGAQNRAVARTFNATASSSGQVVIAFTAGSANNPKVCGITVAPGSITPSNVTLTVTKSGTGTGTVSGGGINCGSTCTASVVSGTSVTLTASAASGSTFGGWSGACSGTSPTCTVSMTAAQTVTATFSPTAPTTYTLTIAVSGSGSTNPSAGSHSYTSGTTVSVSATAASGYTFTGWSGAASGTANPVSISMTGNKTLTATFTASGGQPTGPTSTFPKATSTIQLTATKTISGSFDGGNARYVGWGGDQSEGQDPLFTLADGASLSNVILGSPAGDGVHCKGSCTLTNVWWEDVGEDAATMEGGGTMTINGGAALNASDKVFQHNGSGTMVIKNFYASVIGKLYRSCGNCTTQYQRHSIISNVMVSSVSSSIAGINSNYGDQSDISQVTILNDSSQKTHICAYYQGNNTGAEPPKLGYGPGNGCNYSTSSITWK